MPERTATNAWSLRAVSGANGAWSPQAADGLSLGTAALPWSDLYFAAGGVIDWSNGEVTVSHAANTLSFSGAVGGYVFDGAILPAAHDGGALGSSTASFSDLFLASGGVIDFANGDITLTHGTGNLALAGGSLTLPNTGLHLLDTDASHDLVVKPGSNLTADRTLTVSTGDADRTVSLSGNLTVAGTASINGTHPLSNLTATTNPGVGDDNTVGYGVGSFWINTTLDLAWHCVDASTGAAIWLPIVADPHSGISAGDFRPPMSVHTLSDKVLSTSDRVSSVPFYVSRRHVVDRIDIYLVTAQAGAECRGAVYKNDYAAGRPTTLAEDLGTLDLSTGGGAEKSWTGLNINVLGVFWVSIWTKGIATPATVRGPSSAGAIAPAISQAAVMGGTFGAGLVSSVAYPASAPNPFGISGGLSSSTSFAIPMVRFSS